jgi:hypothetical protein
LVQPPRRGPVGDHHQVESRAVGSDSVSEPPPGIPSGEAVTSKKLRSTVARA